MNPNLFIGNISMIPDILTIMNSRFHSFRFILLLFIFLIIYLPAGANVRLPQLVSNHMVLQRNMKLKIWGWALPGEKVSVRFNGNTVNVITSTDGRWLVTLQAMKEGGPYTMVIKGKNQIVLSDILIGDVWFCSGQSNMVLPMERIKEKYPEEVANDSFPGIRNFFVPTKIDITKVYGDLPPGKWVSAVGTDLLTFGGLGYFFAKQLYLKYHIAIGIINSSVGGYSIDAWMSADALNKFPELADQLKNLLDSDYINNLSQNNSSKLISAGVRTTMPDKGITGPIKWTDPGYTPVNWHRFWLPGYWADQGVKELHGVIYFRKEINVPVSMTGMPAKLFLGRIVDADSTFVNGQFVGNITYQYPPRRYTIPAGILKTGRNIIVVKLVNDFGKGGFVPDKNYSLNANGEKIDLRGDWTYQVAQVQNLQKYEGYGSYEWGTQNSLTGLYNTMVAPAINYGIRGFIWNQGEADCNNPGAYAKYLPALINDWRNKWNEGEIPFLYSQLPGFMEVEYSPSESDWAQLRQSQLKTLKLANTGMAVTIDVGEWNDIHPLDKKDVGERLAFWAEHLSYGSRDSDYSGPIYQSYKIEGNRMIISFSNTGSGLMVKGGGDLYYFSITGADKKFVWAQAKIDGDKISVWSDVVPDPVAVRYAWANNPEGANLYNKKGLPASPFETDDR
jgi:sialate O-acetylesterase